MGRVTAGWVTWLATAATALAMGCAEDAPRESLHACSPLGSAPTESIELGTVLGAGFDADGTLYVIDETADGDVRAFIGTDGVLQREEVSGAGEGSGTTTWTVVTLRGGELLVKVSVDESGAMRMGVLTQASGERDFAIGEAGEELTVVESSELDGWSLVNLPGDVTVEYWAEAPDGRVMLVTRPTNDWDYTDFRVFFGPLDSVDERAVDSVQRMKDGGTTLIELSIDGAPAIATFPTPLGSDAPTLEIEAATVELTLITSEPSPADATFRCR